MVPDLATSDYRPRIADRLLESKLASAGAVEIRGPKWCGKTETALQLASSAVMMQDPDEAENNLLLARTKPSVLLRGARPRLIDEWQDAPQLWDAVRYAVDREREAGSYILTGSATPYAKPKHTGAGRIASLDMLPMSLYESGDSTGEVSLKSLFEGGDPDGHSPADVETLAQLTCRGGWPWAVVGAGVDAGLETAYNLVDTICHRDISRVDGVTRSPQHARVIMQEYARVSSTQAKHASIRRDLAARGTELSRDTIDSYIAKLRELYVIQDLPAWTPSLRARRLKLIASNRRFTILAKPGERRNLASQCLALAAREIPGLWMRRFHYRPLLAETFCDIEHSAGTCYKAAGWTPLGMTKGFTRTNRQECDFYVPNDRPKTLWVKPLVPDALELLNARELPEECALGAQGNSDGVMPIGKERRESLYDALCRVRDTRDSNRTFHIGGMLSIVVMAMMSGANSVKAIARFAKRLDMPQRRELCMPHAKSKAGVVAKHEYKVPSYVTMYNFLKTLDLDDFARKLTEWMSAQEGTLPRQLALDGKFVKEVMGVVSVVNVESGAPVAGRRALQRREPRADKGQPEGTAQERPGGRQGQSPRGL